METYQEAYITALDELRVSVRNLDYMIDGSPEQLRAVIRLNKVAQRLVSAARLELHEAKKQCAREEKPWLSKSSVRSR